MPSLERRLWALPVREWVYRALWGVYGRLEPPWLECEDLALIGVRSWLPLLPEREWPLLAMRTGYGTETAECIRRSLTRSSS